MTDETNGKYFKKKRYAAIAAYPLDYIGKISYKMYVVNKNTYKKRVSNLFQIVDFV